jgi:pre-mRNA-splicing factor SYF1
MLIDFTYREIPERQEGQDKEAEDETGTRLKLTNEDKLEMKMFRLENLIQRRPFLLSNVLLRQNPNNVYEWLNRVKLCNEDTYLTIRTFTQAIQTVNPRQSFGKTGKLWVGFANFYEKFGELQNANSLFHKATQLEFKSVEELSYVFCSWAEMHLRNDNIDSAIQIMRFACTKPHKGK